MAKTKGVGMDMNLDRHSRCAKMAARGVHVCVFVELVVLATYKILTGQPAGGEDLFIFIAFLTLPISWAALPLAVAAGTGLHAVALSLGNEVADAEIAMMLSFVGMNSLLYAWWWVDPLANRGLTPCLAGVASRWFGENWLIFEMFWRFGLSILLLGFGFSRV